MKIWTDPYSNISVISHNVPIEKVHVTQTGHIPGTKSESNAIWGKTLATWNLRPVTVTMSRYKGVQILN